MSLLSGVQVHAQTQVAQGRTLYNTANLFGYSTSVGSCQSCHFAGASVANSPVAPVNRTQGEGAGSNHPEAANHPVLIENAFKVGGVMTNYFGGPVAGRTGFTANATQLDQMFKLALYIGQYKVPAFVTPSPAVDAALAMSIRPGLTGVKNVYSRIVATGGISGDNSSGGTAADDANGGLTVTGVTGNAAAVSAAQVAGSASVAYNVSYRSQPTFAGDDTFTLNVSNPSGSTSQTFRVTVLGITNATLSAQAVKGTTYVADVNPLYTAVCNACAAGTFAVDPAFPLPPGLIVNATSGQISGTPTTAEQSRTVRLQATSSGATHGGDGIVTKDITISVAGISSSNPPTLTQDSAMTTYTVTAFPTPLTAGNYTMSSVPPGLSFNTSNGQLTGTPTTSGTFSNITFGATTAAGAVSQGGFTITVNSAGRPTITTNLPASPTSAGNINASLDSLLYQITVSRPSLTGMAWSATGLPTGLSVNATGQIIGASSQSGDFPLSLSGSNATGVTLTPLAHTLRISPTQAPVVTSTPTIAASPTVTGSTVTPLSIQINASNGPVTSFSATGLPTGLTVSGSGLITGTPTQSGDFSVVLQATNSANLTGSAAAVLMRINSNAPPVVTSTPAIAASPTVTGSTITPLSIQINATNGPITSYSATGLPSGLTISAGGLITGTPTQSGDFSVLLQATNSANLTGSAGAVLMRINPTALPAINSVNAVSSNQSQAFGGYQITATNLPILSYAVVAPTVLPTGLALDTATGAITGIPTVSGSVSTTLTATNAFGTSSIFTLGFTIIPTLSPVVTSSLTTTSPPTVIGTFGSAITPIQINATNGPITSYPVTGLPPGLSVNGSGQIVGTPSLSGDFVLVLRATNASTLTGAASAVTVRISPTVVPVVTSALANTTPPTVIGTVLTAISPIQINATNAPITGYSATGLPPGLSVNASGQVVGTPTQSGDFLVVLKATNSANLTGSATVLTLRINSNVPPVVTSALTTTSPPTVIGAVLSAITPIQINTTNGPITAYSATGLPPGLSINANGQVVGNPSQSGDFSVVLQATNSGNFTGSASAVTIRINSNVPPVVSSALTNTTPPSVIGTVSQAITPIQINSTNGPITGYSATGLPAGLSVNPGGQVVGTPTQSGDFPVVLQATNSANLLGSASAVTIRINSNAAPVVSATPAIAPAPAVTGSTSAPLSIQINATNGPITSFVATGLPSGLSVSASGVISGTPTQSGDFSVVLQATNSANLTGSTSAVTMRINASLAPVVTSVLTSTSPPTVIGTVASPIAAIQINATNGPITGFAATGLPPGLSVNAGGQVVGTPTQSGDFSVILQATNSANFTGSATAVTIRIHPNLAPVVTSTPALAASPTVSGTSGAAITPIQINASNGPITGYSATGLPAGLNVSPTGLISGTPTQSGDFSVVLQAANVVNTGSAGAVTIRINPNARPSITSTSSVAGTASSAFAGYQIIASNAPLTSFGVVAPSVLPPGLALNTSTGAISGVPTTSGTFAVNLSATNAVGTSAPLVVTFNIAPSTTPVVTSPTFASVAAGVAITPIQVVASNAPILSYNASGLPTGLVIHTATGVITGTPTTPGVFPATLGAANAVGPGAGRAVQFTIGIPVPTACAMSVPLNTPTTLDLATCLFNGFSPTGVNIVATPAHGTAVANGTKVTFTPVNNFFGSDAFSFVGTGAGGTSPQGVVSVTVTGRPNPVQDAAVAAVIAAQAETAQRFSRAQISNFQRRLESLHRGAGSVTPAAGALQAPLPAGTGFASGLAAPGSSAAPGVGAAMVAAGTVSTPHLPGTGQASANAGHMGTMATTGAALALPRTIGNDVLAQGAGGALGRVDQASTAAREADVLNAIALGTGLKSLPFSDSVISLIKSRSVDLAGFGSGLGLNTTPDASGNTSYWIEGVASFGTRDASGGFSGSEFSSNGISVGVDKRINKELAVGLGLGIARDTAKIGTDGSINRSKGYSVAVYGSYQLSDNTYLDGLLGVGSLDFDTKRFVAPANLFALGQRGGTQYFGSLTGGYEMRDRDLLVSPYGRLDFSTDRLRTSSETGAGAFALTYFGQTATSVQGALGVRAESVHSATFGYAVPKVRAEFRHEFQGNGEAFVGYANQPGGPRYALASSGGARNAIMLGIGSDFLLRDGLTLSLEYQLSHSFSHDSSYAVRLRLSKDFDARGLPKVRLAEQSRDDDEPLNLQFDAGTTTDSNVTRAKAGADKLNDDLYSFNVSKTWIHGLSETSRVLLTGSLGGEKFHRYNGLSRAMAGAEAEYQYRSSSEFDDPTLGAFAKLTAEGFETSLRDGYRWSVGVSVRQALTDRIGFFGALSHNVRNATSAVFDTRDNSVRANFDYALSNNQTLYLGGEFRRGDIVSTGRPSLENVTIAKVFVQDDAYPGGQMFSYRVGGNTVLATVGYNLSFGTRDSLDFSWRHVRSTPGLRPSFVTSAKSYKANQLSAVYLLRF